MIRYFIVLVLLFYWSCAPDQNSSVKEAKIFYDMEGLIDEQIVLLDSISPSIIKKALVGSEEEITKEDSVSWSDELMLFRSVDINKPILRDSYEISTSEAGNLYTTIYTSKTPKKTTVDQLSVQLIEEGKGPVQILAMVHVKNPLFNSYMRLEMHFQTIEGRQILAKYASKGSQKMVSKDSTDYSIETELIFN